MMDWYQNFLKWFNSRPRWLQIFLIILLSLLVVLGFWLSDYKAQDSASSMMESTSWILGAILKFGIVLLLIYGAAIVFRRWQIGSVKSSTRRMKVIESTALSPRRALFLVQVDGQMFMVGATDQSVNLIAEIETSETTEVGITNGFADSYARAGERLDGLQVK
jgi:flagellar biosynthetic protein FliO